MTSKKSGSFGLEKDEDKEHFSGKTATVIIGRLAHKNGEE